MDKMQIRQVGTSPSEIALHVLPPGALEPKLPWQAFIAVRRMPVPRGVPAHRDLMPIGDYQRDNSRQNCRGDRLACMKKSACPVHALPHSPTKGISRIREETMRPAERIITYMSFWIKYLVVFCGNDV